MVDMLGRQERGCIPGTETSEMFVQCIHVNGGEITLEEAASTHYYAPVCAPIGHFSSPCPHQKPCFELRLQMQQQATAGIPEHEQPQSLGRLGAALVTAAFQGLPTGNQQLQGERNNHGKEKW